MGYLVQVQVPFLGQYIAFIRYQYKNFQSTNKSSGWSPASGYSEDDEMEAYPQRALFSGAKAGLSLTLTTAGADIDHQCSAGMQGYKVHLHHPAQIPSVMERYLRVSLDEAVVVAVIPEAMTTNEVLTSYQYTQRKCYFPDDKPLRFFKAYNQQNCYTECLTNFSLNVCKCVAFHMPRISSTPICGAGKRNCLLYAEETFLINQVSSKIKRLADEHLDNGYTVNESCDCLPSCISTNYNGEISQTPWNWKKFYDSPEIEIKGRLEKRPVHNSKLIVFFKDRQIMTSQRNELYGHTDFIANCGGLLGLFIGFSFISSVEFIYFLTLRLITNLRKYGRHFWSGNPELLKEK